MFVVLYRISKLIWELDGIETFGYNLPPIFWYHKMIYYSTDIYSILSQLYYSGVFNFIAISILSNATDMTSFVSAIYMYCFEHFKNISEMKSNANFVYSNNLCYILNIEYT